MEHVDIAPRDPTCFEPLLAADQAERFAADLTKAADAFAGRTFWHVNSTSAGGGVAEMLQSVLCYLQGGGIETRWAVVEGDDDFFVVTKRIHHFLHGSEGDGGALDDQALAAYRATLERQVGELTAMVGAGDVVVLHDPQTAGFAPVLADHGAAVIWNCHVGVDEPNQYTRQAWDFLAPFATRADRGVFSRPSYVWDVFDRSATVVIPPCIDAFSAKNQWLEDGAVTAILIRAGLVTGRSDDAPAYAHQDGTPDEVRSRALVMEEDTVDGAARIVTQISRWDPLKDHRGVMEGFCRHVPERTGAHLILAGPSPESIADDPEGSATLDELRAAWADLPAAERARVHIACLPMDDLEENAAVVNALQRRADVVVQKSLAEGFGLTVAEAMWKQTPTVASAVGGIQDQIEHGVSGLLLDDATDLAGFGQAVTSLLDDADCARRLGRQAHESVRDHYLAPCYLSRYLELALDVRRP